MSALVPLLTALAITPGVSKEIKRVTPRQRQLLDRLFIDDSTHNRVIASNQRGLGRDVHGRGERTDRKCEIERDLVAHANDNVLLRCIREAVMVHGYFVVSGPKIRENKQAVLVRVHHLLEPSAGLPGGYARVRDYGAGVVMHRSLNGSIHALAISNAC